MDDINEFPYTLVVVYPDGTTGKDKSSNMDELMTQMFFRMNRKFEKGIPQGSVTFHVTDNTIKKEQEDG